MSLCDKHIIEDKYCLFYCGPEKCNCRQGNPVEWGVQDFPRSGVLAKEADVLTTVIEARYLPRPRAAA